MYRNLREFVDGLEAQGELVRITKPVSPILEIAEIADRVSKSRCAHEPGDNAKRTDPRFWDRGGQALLFENVEGSRFPVLINAWGSYRRMAMALRCQGEQVGIDDGIPGGFEAVGDRIGAIVKPEPPRNLPELIEKAKAFLPLLKIKPKRVRSGVCQEIIYKDDAVDLSMIPALRCWPHDGDFASLGYPPHVNDDIPGIETGEWDGRGRYITLAGIHSIHADDLGDDKPRSHNIGMYRVQLLGKRRVAMHWHMHHDGASHWRSWKKRGRSMPVAIALGGEPVLPYAATAPLPPGISELLLAGFLNSIGAGGGGIRMTRGVTVPLWVPANAEIVIEGYVSHEAGYPGYDPRDEHAGPIGQGAVFEGPFGDHTGFYSLPDRYPIVEVTAITHRNNAIYPTTIVGPPPQEDYYLGKATERIFLPLLKTLIHDIEDYDLPMFGAFHNCAVIQIRKQYPLQARRVMHAVWGAGQMAWTKCVIVVEDDVDVHDSRAVLRRMAETCLPSRDLELVNGPLDILDHAAPRLAAGGKIGFDCTRKWPGEEVNGVPVPLHAGKAWKLPSLGPAEAADYLAAVKQLEGVLDAAMPTDAGAGWLFLKLDAPSPGEADWNAGAGAASPHLVRDLIARVWAVYEAAAERDALPRFLAVFSRDVDVSDADAALFRWLANMDPTRDIVFEPAAAPIATDPAPHFAAGPRVAFDATAKANGPGMHGQPVRDWPPYLAMDQATIDRVAQRWDDYQIR